ncbi:MAG TPA: carbon storage regulator CsrA [Fibrobacteraceae bacterium]|nr:carbon storage regulator CsrA [Fibrobacteraceae bacterium]
MLVLTRKPGESIRLGDNIRLTVVEIDGSNIKIGIDAPRTVSIYREEVYQRIKEENQAAVTRDVDMGSLTRLFKPKR